MDLPTQKVEKGVEVASARGVRWLQSRYAGSVLAVISFAESLFLPVLIDPFLVALILAKRTKWMYYTAISIIAWLLGGIAGYLVGWFLFDTVAKPLLESYGLMEDFVRASGGLDQNGFVFVLIGALTPIPYKIVAIASGVGQVSFVTFVVASIFGRILRLGLVGYIAYAVGPHALPLFRKHLLSLAYIFLVLFLVYLGVKWFM